MHISSNNFSRKTFGIFLAILFPMSAMGVVTRGLYALADLAGTVTDPLLAKSHLSQENTKLFNEIVEKLNIQSRGIKAKNSSTLLRFLCGYNTMVSVCFFNRVFFNETLLNQMSLDEKKFIITQELIKQRNFFLLHKIALVSLGRLTQSRIDFFINNHFPIQTTSVGSLVKMYVSQGINFYLLFRSGRLLDLFLALSGVQQLGGLSIIGLFMGNTLQHWELSTDKEAMKLWNIHPAVAQRALRFSYLTDTKEFPFYAKVDAFFRSISIQIGSFPIIKYHVPWVSPDDRMKYLNTVELSPQTS